MLLTVCNPTGMQESAPWTGTEVCCSLNAFKAKVVNPGQFVSVWVFCSARLIYSPRGKCCVLMLPFVNLVLRAPALALWSSSPKLEPAGAHVEGTPGQIRPASIQTWDPRRRAFGLIRASHSNSQHSLCLYVRGGYSTLAGVFKSRWDGSTDAERRRVLCCSDRKLWSRSVSAARCGGQSQQSSMAL